MVAWTTMGFVLLGAGLAAEASIAAQRLPGDKVLRAATRRADRARRQGTKIKRKFDAEIVYIEEDRPRKEKSVFASQLKVFAERPILSLEEIEHHLTHATCEGNVLKLGFVDKESAADARAACHGEDGGLVITSHEGCNVEGERSVYRIHDVRPGRDGTSLELDIAQSAWEHAFSRFEIGWGHTTDAHNYRRFRRSAAQKRAEKTQNVNPPDGTPENVNQVTFDLAWKLENKTFDSTMFLKGLPPGFAPTTDLTNIPIEIGCKKCETKGQLVLSQGAINIDMKQLKPLDVITNIPNNLPDPPKLPDIPPPKLPDIPAPSIPDIPLPKIPSPFRRRGLTISPLEVPEVYAPENPDTTSYRIPQITAPNMMPHPFHRRDLGISLPKIPEIHAPKMPNINPPKISNPFDRRGLSLSSVVTGGFFELKANGMEGSFEMFARPKASGSFSLMLFGLPVLGFYIPGIGRAGAVFEASLDTDYEVDGKIELNYGMKLKVPDGASIRAELTDPGKSNVNGFADTTLEPLPFTFDIEDVNAGLSLAMVPSIPIGFKFANMLDASVSVDLELPRLDANMAMVRDVTVNCTDPPEATVEARGLVPKALRKRQDNGTADAAPFANETALIPGPLVHIEVNASMMAQLSLDFKFPLLPAPMGAPISASAKIFSTQKPLPTMCLVPQSKFAPASIVFVNGVSATPVAGEGTGTAAEEMPMPTGNMSKRWAGEEIFYLGGAGRSTGGGTGWGLWAGVLGVSFAVGGLMVGL